MIIHPDHKTASEDTNNEDGPSVVGHRLVDLIPEPPPAFAPYDAEHFEVGYRDVVSHDPHLNTDGEALYRFLLAQTTNSLPHYRITIRGTHNESRTRLVTHRDSHGRSRTRTESYTDTVTDFDFCVDILPADSDPALLSHIARPRTPCTPIHWTVADDEPVYRGKMVRERESGQHKATRKETKEYKRRIQSLFELGFPPWADPGVYPQVLDPATVSTAEKDTLRSSKTLRQWADEYCASPKHLKEFVYTKTLYGWNISSIENAIQALVRATPYNGDLSVSTTGYNTKIYIRPDNKVSRCLSNKWLKFLSIILFIFPFIWLFKRFHSRGGGKWEVAGAAYALKSWVPVDTDDEQNALNEHRSKQNDELPSYSDLDRSPSSSSSSPVKKLVGIKEGEWFRSLEPAITRAVLGRYQSTEPLARHPNSTLEARGLDGYLDGHSNVLGRLVDY